MLMAKLKLAAPLIKDRLTAGLDARYMGARMTLTGGEAKEYVVTNASILAPSLFRRFELSATAYNLFGVRYGNPGSEEHRQDVILQDGRQLRLQATFRR